MNEPDKMTFEEALRELEATIHRLEEGDLPLEEAISLYERGMRLAQRCNEVLNAAELQVQQLMVGNNQQQIGMFLAEAPDRPDLP